MLLGNGMLSSSVPSVIESWRDLLVTPGGARRDDATPPVARAVNSLFALLVLIGLVWLCLISLPLEWSRAWDFRVSLLAGWMLTVKIAAAALVLSILFGFILALCSRSPFLPLRYFTRFLVETMRCIPLLALIYLIWYGFEGALAIGNDWRLPSGILILTLFESAYISEIFRAGIESVGKTQIESARAIGFTRAQTYRHVIIPQAFRQVLPPLVGQLVSLIKDSSLLSVIAIAEFTQSAQQASSINYANLEDYFALAVGYLILTVPISLWSRWLERRFKYET
jgi:polar amino acid transport system permease protein